MKTLILTDQTFTFLMTALERSDEGQDVINRLYHSSDPLPEDRELVQMARAGEGAPAAITSAVERRDAARAAESETRQDVERLLLHVHGAGVGPAVLMRWFGYNNSRLFQILTKAREQQEAAAS